MVGGNNRRCREDEMLLNLMLGPASRGYIIDTRSQSAAQAAKAKGEGESEGACPHSLLRAFQCPIRSQDKICIVFTICKLEVVNGGR